MSIPSDSAHKDDRTGEFSELFREFAVWSAADGRSHVSEYSSVRQQGRDNYLTIAKDAKEGKNVTDQVLLGLLPYAATDGNRKKGAWVHFAPSIQADLRKWFEGAGWAIATEWGAIATSILQFVQRCNDHPDQLVHACREFAESPHSRGLQTGMLTPILNALRPDDFFLVNNKSRQAINYFAGTSHGQPLTEYPATNHTAHALIEKLAAPMREVPTPALAGADLFDFFAHWLVAIKKFPFPEVRYWKVAPGEGASDWDNCREQGYIGVGWGEFGNVSLLTEGQFRERLQALLPQHPKWTEDGTDQVWRFSRIRVGDRVVANRGTTEVVGIGTVTGPYYFAASGRYPHRLSVEWDDVELRSVKQGGWRKTLIELDRRKFEEILRLSGTTVQGGPPPHAQSPFTEKTFALLDALHDHPTKEYYGERKAEFRDHLEEPFQRVFRAVAGKVRADLVLRMETESGLFSRIGKNDWGRGGAWDFYWGAFYPKGGKRTEDAQLFMVLNRSQLRFGFSIGEYASARQARFVKNCNKYGPALHELLEPSLSDGTLVFGQSTPGAPELGEARLRPSWESWLSKPEDAGIGAAVEMPGAEVIAKTTDELTSYLATTYERLFPLVLVAVEEDPLPAIRSYLAGNRSASAATPLYSLAQFAQDSFLEEGTLVHWVRAIERKRQAIFYGPPGTGKTYLAERLARHLAGGGDGTIEIVQFHPAYAYEDFIQGIRPAPRTGGGLDYPMVPGRFLEFCARARERKDRSILIVDEINRANLARVFGELMYLLEYRDKEVPLAGGGRFRIPETVRIIGTMNTADRSIALVDYALRRRFAFLPLYPNYEVLRRYHDDTGYPAEDLVEILQRLNHAIDDRHYEVGISFFLLPDLGDHIEDIWTMEIEPYLEEYFYDQVAKVDEFRWERVRTRLAK